MCKTLCLAKKSFKNSKSLLVLFCLISILSSSCNKTKSEAEINYNFEKDQYFPISNREALTKIEDFVKYTESPSRDSEDELINLNEALFIFEGSMNYLKSNPEETDQTTLIENTFDIMIPAEFDENNGTYLISTSDIANALDEANVQIESILGDGNHSEEKMIQLVDGQIESTDEGEVKIAVSTLSGNTFNISDFWNYNLFPEDEYYYAVARKNSDIENFSGGNPGYVSCNLPNTNTFSYKLIHEELNQLFFPVEERAERIFWVNPQNPISVSSISPVPSEMNPNQDCFPSLLDGWATSWGCLDWLWENEGGYVGSGFPYPIATNAGQVTSCISGEKMNQYMDKTIEFTVNKKNNVQSSAPPGTIVGIAYFDYSGYAQEFTSYPGFGNPFPQIYYRGDHSFEIRLAQKIVQ